MTTRPLNDKEWLEWNAGSLDTVVKCNWKHCAGGMGLAGHGRCSFRGDWGDSNCPKFITEDDYEKQEGERRK
jgi:hypothetical protein